MFKRSIGAALLAGALCLAFAAHAAAQAHMHEEPAPLASAVAGDTMFMRMLGGGWMLMGMAQAYPVVTAIRAPDESPLDETAFYLTQPVVMANVESPGSRFVLRTTLDFEGLTIEDGELTFGGWGEGFIDKRHPHTLLHELMLSVNAWDALGGAASLSVGKGFAPYGTDDPMARPPLKYPTNHHLSQILERWTVNATYVRGGWGLEAGWFGGAEPEGPYDLSNIESFGDSWSARLTRRFGSGANPTAAPWELGLSYGSVEEEHHGVAERTSLVNAYLRHERVHALGRVYALAEASRSEPEDGDGFFSLLAETSLRAGAHWPYYRIEYATRPEFEREGPPGTEGFFRYHHDDDPIGATRWLIHTLGYGYALTGYPFEARPFIEVKHSSIDLERGSPLLRPELLFGDDRFWSLSAGFRIFIGGSAMRMGAYGVLDAMTAMHRPAGMADAPPAEHHGH